MPEYACNRPAGWHLIVDSGLVKDVLSSPGPALQRAHYGRGQAGNRQAITANIVALGVVNTIAGIVSPEALEKAV